jgi:ABC-type glycerol-3-phosphate transport system substrate-binding protein
VGPQYPYYTAREKVWKKWEESHPNVKVEYEYFPYDQFFVQINTRALAGEAPPIAQDGYHTPQYVTAGNILVQTDDYLAKSGWKRDDMWDALWRIVEWGGKTWGAPFTMDTRFTYVNPGLYKKAGVEYPKTWDDMLAIAKPFRDIGAYAYTMCMTGELQGFWETGALMIKTDGSEFIVVNPDGTASATVDTPEALDVCEQLLKMQEVEAVPPSFLTDSQTEGQSLFGQERVASITTGNWMIETFKQWRKDGTMKFEDDCIHNAIKKQRGSSAGGWSWYIFQTIKDPDLGWDFVNFFLQDENVNEGWADSLPPTKRGMELPYYASEPKNKFVAEVLAYSSFPVPPVAGFFDIMPVIWKYVMKALSKALSPQEALKLGQQEVQQLLDEGHNKLVKG